jgi:hypothetical protein
MGFWGGLGVGGTTSIAVGIIVSILESDLCHFFAFPSRARSAPDDFPPEYSSTRSGRLHHLVNGAVAAHQILLHKPEREIVNHFGLLKGFQGGRIAAQRDKRVGIMGGMRMPPILFPIFPMHPISTHSKPESFPVPPRKPSSIPASRPMTSARGLCARLSGKVGWRPFPGWPPMRRFCLKNGRGHCSPRAVPAEGALAGREPARFR